MNEPASLTFTLPMLLSLFGSAIVGGLFGALLGIGGGMFIVPVMVFGFHLPMRVAVAASIVSVIATSNAGGSAYVEKHIANIKLAMYLEVFTSIGAIGGAMLALRLSEWLMFLVFAALMLYMAYGSFTTRNLDDQRIAANTFETAEQTGLSRWLSIRGAYYDLAARREVRYAVNGAVIGAVISLLAGLASGLLGVGGGVLKVSAMNRFMNTPMKVAVGTSKLMIGITAAVSSLIFLMAGSIQFLLVGPVALGTTVGATLGTHVMNRFKSSTLKWTFVAVVLYTAYSMIAKALDIHWHIHIPYLT